MMPSRPTMPAAPLPAVSIAPGALALVAAISLGVWGGLAHLAALL